MDRSYHSGRRKSRRSNWSRESTNLPLIPEKQLHFDHTIPNAEANESKNDQTGNLQYALELTNPYVTSHLRTSSMMDEIRHRRETSTMSDLYLQEPRAPKRRHWMQQPQASMWQETSRDGEEHQPAAPPAQRSSYSDDSDSSDQPSPDMPGPSDLHERSEGQRRPLPEGEPGPLVTRVSSPHWPVQETPKPSWYPGSYSYMPFQRPSRSLAPPGPYYYDPTAPKQYSQYENERIMDIPGDEYPEEVLCQTWTPSDVQELKRQVELAERFKWKYISDRLAAKQHHRIPAIACQRKFKEMFGVAEASSKLRTSLFYVAYRSGWPTIRDSVTQLDADTRKPGNGSDPATGS